MPAPNKQMPMVRNQIEASDERSLMASIRSSIKAARDLSCLLSVITLRKCRRYGKFCKDVNAPGEDVSTRVVGNPCVGTYGPVNCFVMVRSLEV